VPSGMPIFLNPEFVTSNEDYKNLIKDVKNRNTTKNSPRQGGIASGIHNRSISVGRADSVFAYSNLRLNRN